MAVSNQRSAWSRIILVQLGIVAALLMLYKVYMPRMQRHNLAKDVEAREQRIQKFTRTMIVEDSGRDASGTSVDGQSISHPQKLLQEESVDEVQQALGAPGTEFSDAGGGQHLTWTGTDHKLEAAFNKGVLYNLTYTNIRTGRGVTVFESSQYWQSF